LAGHAEQIRHSSEDARGDRPTQAQHGPAEAPRYAIFNRRRKSFYLQRPDGSPMTFDSPEQAQAVCNVLNREDPNDAEPEYRVEEVRE
jgi:hypothetical protein